MTKAKTRYVDTQAQAAAWIAQELAKHTTPESRARRIKDEAFMVEFCATSPKYALELAMHKGLVEALEALQAA